jgi:arylsulfatase A-like enzyme
MPQVAARCEIRRRRSRYADNGPQVRRFPVFAGFLSHTDHHIGRLLDFLKEISEFDNFLALVRKMQGWIFTDLPVGAHVIPQL